MKKTLLAMRCRCDLYPAMAEVKLGIALGFTGSAESLAEAMARGAELRSKKLTKQAVSWVVRL